MSDLDPLNYHRAYRGILPFVLGVALGAAATAASIFYRWPPPRPEPPVAVQVPRVGAPEQTSDEPTKTIHVFDWTGSGKVSDLLICSCEPGRLAPAPTPRINWRKTPAAP